MNFDEHLRNYIKGEIFANEINNDTLIFSDGLFDSMGFLGLIQFIENNFNIKVSDSELTEDNFKSINSIVKFINQKNEV